MRVLLPLLIGLSLAGQSLPRLAIVRGEVRERDADGWLRLDTGGGRTRKCRFSSDLEILRGRHRMGLTDVAAGALIEAVIEQDPEGGGCTARTIYLISPMVPATPGGEAAPRRVLGQPNPCGDLTIGGTVVSLDGDDLVVRARGGERKSLRLAEETTYGLDGTKADRSILKPPRRIFIRAGRGSDGSLEACEIVAGRILAPR